MLGPGGGWGRLRSMGDLPYRPALGVTTPRLECLRATRVMQQLCDQRADGAWVRARRLDIGDINIGFRPFDNVATIRFGDVCYEISGKPIPIPD